MATDSAAILYATLPLSVRRNISASAVPEVESELESGFITQYSGANVATQCAQARYNPAAYSQTSPFGVAGIFASGSGSTGAKISSAIGQGIAAIPVVGPFLSSVWNAINPFAHHAQAVAKEQTALCTYIPQVNSELAATDAAVEKGDISAQEADARLEALVQGFDSSTASITQDYGNKCNAGCVMQGIVRAEATLHEQKYRNSPLYYLKRYWWVGAAGLLLYFFMGGFDR